MSSNYKPVGPELYSPSEKFLAQEERNGADASRWRTRCKNALILMTVDEMYEMADFLDEVLTHIEDTEEQGWDSS